MKNSLFTKTKRILSLVLCLCLVWTMVPGQTMGAYAVGVASGPMIPEFGVTANDLWCCFANGTPITIEEGTESGTAIYYYENGNRVYLNPNGAGGDNLSELVVFGGSRSYDILKSDTSVTMIGGQVKAIYAAQIWGDVNGNANVYVTSSAKVEQVVMRSYFDGGVDGETSAFVINGAKLSGKLNNYLYKNGSQWEIVGRTALPGNENLSIDSDETVTIRDGQFESMGTINNYGTVVIHETAEFINSGTFYNGGTIEALSIIQGNIQYGSINYLLPYIPFTETAADVDLSVSVNGVHVENPEYAIYNDRLWLETKPGEIVAELNGVKYYGTYEKGSAAELKPFVSVERVEVTFAPSGQHVNGPIYKIYTKAEPEDATYQTPSFALESTDGAFITNGNELVVSKGGTYTVNVTIPKGRDGTNDFTSTADFTYEFIEVEDIDFTLKEIEVGETASLSRHKVITPSNATSDSCRYDIISGDAAVIEDNNIRGVKEGKVTLRVTAISAEGWNHPKYEDFEITVKHIPVTEIPGVPEQLTANHSVQLPAKALPENSTSRDIVWSIADGAEATGASLNGNVLSVTKAGMLTLEATVKDGLAEGKDFVQTYEIRVNYIPVTAIPEIPTELSAYAALELPAKALPENASSRDIVWTITEGASDSDAIINENVLVAKKAGTLKLKATVKDGTDSGTDFEQEYTVTVKENTALDITKGSIVITEEDDTHNRIKFQGFAEDAIWSKDTAVILTGSVTITRGMGSFLTVDGTSANIVLDDVKIEMPGNSTIESPNSIQLANGATVEMDLKGDNSIDGGYNKSAVYVPEGTSLTIDSSFGGSLTAEATGFGAAIGGGKKEAAGTITINGGTVTARTSDRGAAIGGGGEAAGTVNVIINGGNVTAEATGYYGAAAIGSAYDSSSSVNVIIRGGTVRADAASGAAIGSGFSSSSSVNVIIRGGTVTAAGVNGAGIGSHTHSTEDISIVIAGGNINASSSKGNAVGNGYAAKGNVSLTNGTDNVFLRTITLHGAESNTGITDMDIGYGLKDVKTLEGGNLYFYLPADPEVNSITAGDTEYICKNSSLVYYSEHDWSNGVCSRCGEVCSHEGETGANCNVCGKSLHIHSWIYTAVGNTVKATCTAENCNLQDGNGGFIRISAPADLYTNGKIAREAVVDNQLTDTSAAYEITYSTEDGMAPDTPGTYTASLTLSGEKASVEFTLLSYAASVTDKDGKELTGSPYKNLADAVSAAKSSNGSKVTLLDDVTLTEQLNISSGDFTLDLNGNIVTATGKYALYISGSATRLIVDDSHEEGGIRNSSTETFAAAIYVREGVLDIYGGKISTEKGYALESKGTINIYAGDIRGYRYPVYNEGTLNIFGGVLHSGIFERIVISYTKQISVYGGEFPEGMGIYDSGKELFVNDLLADGCFYRDKRGKLITTADEATQIRGYVKVTRGADLSDAFIVLSADEMEYSIEGAQPDVTVKIGGKIIDSTNYTVSYANQHAAGTATVTITAKESTDYTGTKSREYTIVPASISDAEVTVTPSEMTYTGQAQTPEVAVTLDGKVLTSDNYTVSYSDNINAGTAKAAVTGKGNYTGTAAVEFTIAKAVPAASDFTFAAPADLTFTGSAKSASVTPVPSISGMGSVTVKYEKEGMEVAPVNAGTYTVKIEVAEGTNYTAAHGLTDAAWTFTIAKAEASYKAPAAQNYLKYNGAAQKLVTAGSTDHGTMMYKLNHGQWSSEVPSAVNAGEYTVSYYVAGDENHNDSEAGSVTVNIAKATPALGTVSAVIEANKTSAAEIVISRSDETVPGKLAIDPAAGDLVWGNNLVGFTFEPDDTANYRTITAGLITVVVTDTLAPDGEVKLETNSWKELVNNVTFGLFFNRNVELEVSVEDALSGVKTIEYLAASDAMTEDAVKAAEGWKAVGADRKIGVTAADAEESVYYIRITDKAGNMAYLSTDGMVFDLTAPAITGVTDGGVYYTTQKVQISDANLADGVEAEQTLAGNVDKTYEVEAADKAGNTAKVTITMKPISTLSEVIKDLTEGNVTGDSSDELAAVEETLKAVDTANATEAEKQALEDAKANVDHLQKVIEDAAEELGTLEDEAEAFDSEKVTSDDKVSVEELIEDLQEQLNHPNLTEAQKEQVKEAIADAQEILDKIAEDQQALTDALEAVKDITEEDVKNYNNQVVKEHKTKLEEAKTTLETLLNDDNYTAEEKAAMQEELDRIQELIKTAEKQINYNNIPEVQKPKVETAEGAEVELSSNGSKAEITVKEGYELEDVLVNGESKGKVTALTGLKTGDKVQVLVKKMKSAEEILMGELDNIQLTARSKSTKLNGKKAIKIWWYEADRDNIEFFDGYQVFRSVKRYSGFGKKPFFTTEKTSYTNNKDLKSGNTYYYKVRGYVELNGKKYYSDWSRKAWRVF